MKKVLICTTAAILLVLSFWLVQTVFAAEVAVDTTVATNAAGRTNSGNNAVWTSDSNGYVFYTGAEQDLEMASTTDGGATWSVRNSIDSINTTDVQHYAIWWEGWTATTSTRYIHIVTTDSSSDIMHYTQLDLNDGSLSTTVTMTAQSASCLLASCFTAITMAENGVLYATAADGQDSWVERCSTTCTTGANWSEIAGGYVTASAADLGDDRPLLFPVGGTNNIALVYWDISADTIDYNQYSATSSSWWFTADSQQVESSVEDNLTYDGMIIGATVATTTGIAGLTFSNDTDEYTVADHDIDFYTYASSTGWVSKTNILTDDAGGVTGAKVAVDTSTAGATTWYAVYSKRTTIGTLGTGNVYYKTSTDGGTTWSAESAAINDNADDIRELTTSGASIYKVGAWWSYETTPRDDDEYYDIIADLPVAPPPAGETVTRQSEFFF